MAKIVVTSTTNTIKVEFNDYATIVGIKKRTWNKTKISFGLSPSEDMVYVFVEGEPSWSVVYSALAGSFIVDSVAGVSPITSNSDLYDKLIALIA